MLNKMFISHGVFLALLCKKKPSEMVFSVLPLAHAQPGSGSEADWWLERRGFCGSREKTSTSPLPCCRGAGGSRASAEAAASPVGEDGPILRHRSGMWLEVERQVLGGGLQPVSPSKKNTSPAHRGEGAGAASAQPDLWAPAGWKKSSEHFSKSSLRQKLQSDRCKSPPDPQLLPLLSQPWAAGEVTLAPRVVGMAMGSVQAVVGAPQAPLRLGFCNRTSTGSS